MGSRLNQTIVLNVFKQTPFAIGIRIFLSTLVTDSPVLISSYYSNFSSFGRSTPVRNKGCP